MARNGNDGQAIRELRRQLRLERDRQMRMYSNTFWEGWLDIERRVGSRVASVAKLLEKNGIEVEMDGVFGSEPDRTWLTFTVTNVEPWPSDEWFEQMATKQLDSESEVQSFFINKLLLNLGYQERDLALQHQLTINQGKSRKYYEADLVVLDCETQGAGRGEEALLVVEAKRPGELLSLNHANQGRSYAQWLNAPLYLISNANLSRLYYNPPSLTAECILEFTRSELRDRWPELVHYLSKESVSDLKTEIRERLRDVIKRHADAPTTTA